MVIEFNGLPGCGKSTIAHQLIDELTKKGYEIEDASSFQTSIIKRVLTNVFVRFMKLNWMARAYARSFHNKKDKDKNKIISLLVFYYKLYKKFTQKSNGEILIIEQGFIQALISIAHADKIKDRKKVRSILEFFVKSVNDLYIVNCELDIDTANTRIINRKSFGGRLDVCDNVQRQKILKTQKDNFKIIRDELETINKIKQININTNLEIADNTKKIMEFCEKQKHESKSN